MFKLTELFVEIKGNDDPLRASIDKLKGSMGSVASSISSVASGAFSSLSNVASGIISKIGGLGAAVGSGVQAALGPIAIITAAAAGLYSMLGDDQKITIGEDFKKALAPNPRNARPDH